MSQNSETNDANWTAIAPATQFPADAGAAALVAGEQVAIFNFGHQEWFAVQNLCPHRQQMCLSRGLVGDSQGRPKVTCPLHKNSFFLEDGRHAGGNPSWQLKTWAIKVEEGTVYVRSDQ